jgi:hypothetical protein
MSSRRIRRRREKVIYPLLWTVQNIGNVRRIGILFPNERDLKLIVDGLADFCITGVRGIPSAWRRVDDAAVRRDLVDPSVPLDELGANAKTPFDCGGQTGRPREVVSFTTVSYFDVQIVVWHLDFSSARFSTIIVQIPPC